MGSQAVMLAACLGLGLACSLTPRSASAWEAVQLTLQATAFSYQKTTVTQDGASASASASTTSFGLVNEGLGAGVGYASDHLLFGGRAQFLVTSSSGNDVSTVQLLPRLEYLFDPGVTSPYLAAILGLEYGSSSASGGATLSSTNFVYGAAFGVHGFVDPAVSLDPEIALLGASGSTTLSESDIGDQKASDSAVTVMLTLGLSAWLGARPEPHPAPAADAVAAPPPPPRTSASAPAPASESEPDEEEAKPLFTNIHLPGHRRLYVQMSQNPAHSALLIRLSEAQTENALAACADVTISGGASTLKMRVRSHGDHFVAGVIAPRAVELLANSEAQISVCGAQWTLGAESREALQGFLNERRGELLLDDQNDEAEEPAPPVAARPGAAPAAPSSPAASATPTGSASFPAPPALTPKTK